MTTPWQEQERRATRFVDEVSRRIRKSPGDAAALRRSLGRSPANMAHALVAHHLPDEADEATERAFYGVAALIASQPRAIRDQSEPAAHKAEEQADAAPEEKTTPGKSFGTTLAEAVAADKSRYESTEARLHLLCRQRVNGVHRHLPRLIAHLQANRVHVDWPRLLVDLSRWGADRDRVTKRWLQDYYRTYHRALAAKKASTQTNESENQ
jgi:CRISPR system Cascade subunit CasB